MKPKNVQTKVQYYGQRKPGDAPNIGRVTRMPGAGLPRELRKRSRGTGRPSTRRIDKRRERRLRARKFAITIWLSILLLACLGALGTGTIVWLRSQEDRKNIAPQFVHADVEPLLRLTDFPPPNEREALQVLKNALEANNEEVLRMYVRDTEEVTAEDMLAFFAATPDRDGTFTSHQWVGSSDTDRLQIQSMLVIFDKDGRMSNRLAMLVPDETGTWRLDFPSFARWCDPPISRLDDPGGHPGGQVRVAFARDHYYNGMFSDDREWACYTVTSPDSEANASAYCRIDSPQHRAMDALLASDARMARATLEIDRVEGASQRQFQITRVLADGWIPADARYDARFE